MSNTWKPKNQEKTKTSTCNQDDGGFTKAYERYHLSY